MALYTTRARLRLLPAYVLIAVVGAIGYDLRPPFVMHSRRDNRSSLEKSIEWVIPQAVGCVMVLATWASARWRWHPPGYCRRCGYDLRGTLAAGRGECPECGQPIHGDALSGPAPPPRWMRIAYIALIVAPIITAITASFLAKVPVPYEAVADPRFIIYDYDWPYRFRRALEVELMTRYMWINLAVMALAIAVLLWAPLGRRPSLFAMLSVLVSFVLFCVFVLLWLPRFR